MLTKESQRIKEMFASIAPRYDLLNHVLSFSVDRRWRRHTAEKLAPYFSEGDRVLDLCTGTGDLAFEMAGNAKVVACDFCHPMLALGQDKTESKLIRDRVCFVEGDALGLPFAPGLFKAVTIAFGLRNLEDYCRGLDEMWRVLQPGGVLAILEFSEPWLPVFRELYLFYFVWILPRVGRWISGREGAYSYLAQSVREFPTPAGLAEIMSQAGFQMLEQEPLTGGIATLHLARKSP